jgi:hypothetical protein
MPATTLVIAQEVIIHISYKRHVIMTHIFIHNHDTSVFLSF